MQQQKEPLLQEDEARYVTFPIKYTDIWQSYKKQVGNFWVAEEIDLSNDIKNSKIKIIL